LLQVVAVVDKNTHTVLEKSCLSWGKELANVMIVDALLCLCCFKFVANVKGPVGYPFLIYAFGLFCNFTQVNLNIQS